MFGKDRIKNIIQNNSGLSANAVLNAVFAATEQFQGKSGFEDDATMAVIKIVKNL